MIQICNRVESGLFNKKDVDAVDKLQAGEFPCRVGGDHLKPRKKTTKLRTETLV